MNRDYGFNPEKYKQEMDRQQSYYDISIPMDLALKIHAFLIANEKDPEIVQTCQHAPPVQFMRSLNERLSDTINESFAKKSEEMHLMRKEIEDLMRPLK